MVALKEMRAASTPVLRIRTSFGEGPHVLVVRIANEGTRAVSLGPIRFYDNDGEVIARDMAPDMDVYASDKRDRPLLEGDVIRLVYTYSDLKGVGSIKVVDAAGRVYEAPANPFLNRAQPASWHRALKKLFQRGSV